MLQNRQCEAVWNLNVPPFPVPMVVGVQFVYVILFSRRQPQAGVDSLIWLWVINLQVFLERKFVKKTATFLFSFSSEKVECNLFIF